MSIQSINIGTVANDGTGDTLRTAFSKTNDNFTQLVTSINTVQANVDSVVAGAVGSDPTAVNTVQSNVTALTSSVNTIRANVNSVQSNVTSLTSSVNTVQSNVTALTASVNTIRANVNSVQSNVSTLSTFVNSIKSNVDLVQSTAATALQPGNLISALSILWVDPNGSDTAAGNSINYPLKTIAAAVSRATAGTVIVVQAGTYTETCPLILPRNVAVVGSSLRAVTVKPTTATRFNNMWLVDSGNYLTGMTFSGHQAGAWAVAFNSGANNTGIGASGLGAYILKSPYIQNCTSYTAQDDSGEAGSVSDGTTGGGMLVDGAACAPNSPIRSMVVDSYTQVNLDGPGCLVTNDAYAQLVSFFGTFCSYHVKATLGGQVNLSNSTTDFGIQGLVANGRSATALFQGSSGGAAIGQNTVNVTSLTTNRLGASNKPNTGQVFNIGSNYYTVTGSVPVAGGYTVTFYPYLTSASTAGATISFYQRSQISTGAHTLEYVGAGTNYNALPWNGGVPIPANQIVEEDGGRIFYSTTDELGNFKVGNQFGVNGTTGEVTINTSSFNISGLNQIGPFSRDGGITTVGQILKEISNNTDLLASTGARDGNTVPTQYAVYNYLLNNYTKSSALGTMSAQTAANVSITGGTITGITDLAVADGGTGSSTAAGARTNLGLGAIATQDSANVAITGGVINSTSIGATTRATGAFTTLAVSGSITETVYALTGTTPALNPANGTTQTWTLTANSTPTDSISSGQSVTLMIDDGTAYTITWPSITWKTDAGSAPTLNTTGYTVIVLWKVGSVLYGSRVGDA